MENMLIMIFNGGAVGFTRVACGIFMSKPKMKASKKKQKML